MQFSRKQLCFFSLLMYFLCLVVIVEESLLTFTNIPSYMFKIVAMWALLALFIFLLPWFIPKLRLPGFSKDLKESFHPYTGGWMVWLLVGRFGLPLAITCYALVAIHDQNFSGLVNSLFILASLMELAFYEYIRTRPDSLDDQL